MNELINNDSLMNNINNISDPSSQPILKVRNVKPSSKIDYSDWLDQDTNKKQSIFDDIDETRFKNKKDDMWDNQDDIAGKVSYSQKNKQHSIDMWDDD